MQLPLILKGLPLPILLTLGLSLVTSIKAQGSSPYGSGTIPDIPGGGGSSNSPHVPGGGGSSNTTPHVPGGDGSSNSPYVPGGGGSSNTPHVPGGGDSSNTPHVPGGGGSSNTPHVPGGGGSSNTTPHVPGGDGSSNSPYVPGGGGSSNTPHVPGGGGSSNTTPHIPGGDGSSNTPHVPGGGGSSNTTPHVPGGDGSSNTPHVPGGGGSSNTPHVPGGGGSSNPPHAPGGGDSSNTPHVPGGGGSSNPPHAPGGGGSSNTPHVPGGGGSSNTPHVPGGLVRTCPLTSERLVEPMTYFTVVADPKCPNDNGHTFLTDDGAYYTLLCCTHNPSGTEIDGSRSVAPSFKDCATKCSSTSGCQSYVFSARSNRDDALGTCKLYNGGGFQTTECGDDTHDYAYITAPPTIHSPDTASTACATECPLSDGQQYKSKGGEVFHIDCSKRHGTQVIHEEIHENFQDCMDACSRFIPCHSVDYHTNTPTLSDAREHAMARQHAAVVDRSIT
ncbi:hypothetical protein HAV15_004240 [Penicillium sp. str. |nr:hypothetical protein HAV15_004240 [Penicillium sp. str. \